MYFFYKYILILLTPLVKRDTVDSGVVDVGFYRRRCLEWNVLFLKAHSNIVDTIRQMLYSG